MWKTNLKILLTVVGTLGVYTLVANAIPQVQSAVPEELTIGPDVTPEELAAIGEELYAGIGGCTACHGLGTRAPDLVGVAGTVCESRVPDRSCKEYLHESLVDPTAYVVEGFQPIMLDQSRTLSEPQLWALVAFLESQGGTVTVTADDIGEMAPAGETPAAVESGQEAQEADPEALLTTYGCVACHAIGGQGAAVGPPVESMRGKDAEYIRRGIVEPNADTAQGFEAFAGTMPPTFGTVIPEAEIDALVRFLTGEDGGEAPDDGGDDGSDDGDDGQE